MRDLTLILTLTQIEFKVNSYIIMPLQTEYFETKYLNPSPVEYSCHLHAWIKRIFPDEKMKG